MHDEKNMINNDNNDPANQPHHSQKNPDDQTTAKAQVPDRHKNAPPAEGDATGLTSGCPPWSDSRVATFCHTDNVFKQQARSYYDELSNCPTQNGAANNFLPPRLAPVWDGHPFRPFYLFFYKHEAPHNCDDMCEYNSKTCAISMSISFKSRAQIYKDFKPWTSLLARTDMIGSNLPPRKHNHHDRLLARPNGHLPFRNPQGTRLSLFYYVLARHFRPAVEPVPQRTLAGTHAATAGRSRLLTDLATPVNLSLPSHAETAGGNLTHTSLTAGAPPTNMRLRRPARQRPTRMYLYVITNIDPTPLVTGTPPICVGPGGPHCFYVEQTPVYMYIAMKYIKRHPSTVTRRSPSSPRTCCTYPWGRAHPRGWHRLARLPGHAPLPPGSALGVRTSCAASYAAIHPDQPP